MSRKKLFTVLLSAGMFVVIPAVIAGTVFAAGDESHMASGDVEKLPPAPGEIPMVKAEIDDIKTPAGKEVVLEVYTVKKGDYLVKLAKREYGDMDLWKVIYGYNSYIKDPHWIFPGDNIILPRIVDKIPPAPKKPEKKKPEKTVAKPKEYGNSIEPPDFGFYATIIGFKAAKALYGQGDYVFIDRGSRGGISKGQKLYLYRRGRQVAHPYTGEFMGGIVEKIGEIKVSDDIQDHTATAQIVYSDRPVEAGDMILPAAE